MPCNNAGSRRYSLLREFPPFSNDIQSRMLRIDAQLLHASIANTNISALSLSSIFRDRQEAEKMSQTELELWALLGDVEAGLRYFFLNSFSRQRVWQETQCSGISLKSVRVCNWSLCTRGQHVVIVAQSFSACLALSSFLRAAGSATLTRLTDVTAYRGIVYFQTSQRIHQYGRVETVFAYI